MNMKAYLIAFLKEYLIFYFLLTEFEISDDPKLSRENAPLSPVHS